MGRSVGGWLALAGVTAMVAGMMLVIAGVLAEGVFLGGAVLIGIGMVAFAAAGVVGVWRADS